MSEGDSPKPEPTEGGSHVVLVVMILYAALLAAAAASEIFDLGWFDWIVPY